MKLGLGTVQFGMDYGISNQKGQTPESEVKEVLSLAVQRGLKVIDTACRYGNSEEMIGHCIPENNTCRIVTKTPIFKKKCIDREDAQLLKQTFYSSLKKLRQQSIYGLLIHYSDDLLCENGSMLWESMQELKEEGLVKKIGVSVYSPAQVDAILAFYNIDLVQLPVNIFDQRMIQHGHLKKLKDLGIEIHSRSVFLQGLLLMNPEEMPEYFSSIRDKMMKYREYLRTNSMSQIQAALTFVYRIPEIDTVIVGVNDSRQFRALCEIKCSDALQYQIDFSSYYIEDERIINPFHWN